MKVIDISERIRSKEPPITLLDEEEIESVEFVVFALTHCNLNITQIRASAYTARPSTELDDVELRTAVKMWMAGYAGAVFMDTTTIMLTFLACLSGSKDAHNL